MNQFLLHIKQPAQLERPWTLSRWNDDKQPPVSIPQQVVACLKYYHILAIEFLYHNFRRGKLGSILNQDDGMNFPIQVSAFLRAIYDAPSIVLIVCPNHLTCEWHYNLTMHGNFNATIINSKNCRDDFDERLNKSDKSLALILSFNDLKLGEYLTDYDFFNVTVQNFDEVATKLIFRRLKGAYNIGLSTRSFYRNPDQKLQWTMLNWSNPGCVGKLNDFYEVDNRNLENYRDNYRFWWQRLTWNFCETFERPSEDEKQELNILLKRWAKQHNFHRIEKTEERKSKRSNKRRTTLTVIRSDQASKIPKVEKNLSEHRSPSISSELNLAENAAETPAPTEGNPDIISDSSADTIIYEPNPVPTEKYVKLPSMDENPILTSIIKNFETAPEPLPKKSRIYEPLPFLLPNDPFQFSITEDPQPSTSKGCESESDDFLKNLARGTHDFKAKEPMKNSKSDEPSDFLKGLIGGTARQFDERREDTKSSLDEEIDRILKKADMLLRN